MKKLMIISMFLSSSIFASKNSYIYCPQEIVCKGTKESCYVSQPKNDPGNFVISEHLAVNDPNGRYVFDNAYVSGREINCVYNYQDGTTDPHAAFTVTYENKIRMKAVTGQGYLWFGAQNALKCNSPKDVNKCPAEPIP